MKLEGRRHVIAFERTEHVWRSRSNPAFDSDVFCDAATEALGL
jgi:hypothetical protein